MISTMLIEGMDYTVRLAPWLTGDVPALVSEDEDGHYNIYINEKLAPHAKLESYLHEIEHCEKNDFHSDRTIYEVEHAALPVIPVAEEPPVEVTNRATAEEVDAALRAWAQEWVRQKVAEIEAQARRKPRFPPRGWDDPDLPPPIF